MISVQIKSEKVQKMLRDTIRYIGPEGKKKFYKTVSAVLYKDVIKHFAEEKDSEGKRWARWKDPHSSGRVGTRPYGRHGSKMLQDTGRLRSSILPSHDEDGAYAGSDVVYAAHQNFGDENTPAREFMWISDDAEQKILDYGVKMIEGRL